MMMMMMMMVMMMQCAYSRLVCSTETVVLCVLGEALVGQVEGCYCCCSFFFFFVFFFLECCLCLSDLWVEWRRILGNSPAVSSQWRSWPVSSRLKHQQWNMNCTWTSRCMNGHSIEENRQTQTHSPFQCDEKMSVWLRYRTLDSFHSTVNYTPECGMCWHSVDPWRWYHWVWRTAYLQVRHKHLIHYFYWE